ncbi:hypothetical protein AV530_015393 [Patagioenas fasciata monilis]|uniref:Uncharacterized protein n=1 Tax=Patagioenas fasciata monilis TaxID=372326 RepID=A0A1V4JVB9_PATFA|nr:hypothetical protein AV530_015393 [Patagioenas fasciata monilis]
MAQVKMKQPLKMYLKSEVQPYFSKTSLNCPLQKLEDRTLDHFSMCNLPFTEVKAEGRSARRELHIPFLCKCKQLVLVPALKVPKP